MQPKTNSISLDRSHRDWRGWIALAWVICWGVGYCGMVRRARGPQVQSWFRPLEANGPSAVSRPAQGEDSGSFPPSAIGPGDRARDPSSVLSR